ncbi:MAG: MotA/TolQ/ExbB proton channel family protein [Crocinitomicaceae bacterium]|nr:MotA/TolQ/ExbB proton channel family protein [Crocinitomicaceae bacterium]
MKIKFKSVALIIALFAIGIAFSQEDSGITTAAVETTTHKVKEISALDFLMMGGVWIIPIALLLFYTISVGIEKFLYIRKATKFDASLLNDMQNSLVQGNVESALSTVSRDKTAFGNVIKEGILTIGRPVSEIESNMEKATNIEIGKMEKNLGRIGMIAGVAPTLGFIGTIAGVIKIFYSISVTENVSIGNISAGLYEKMIASGAGLAVGIIAFTTYHLLNGAIDAYVLNIQKVNMDFINIIQRPNGDKTK